MKRAISNFYIFFLVMISFVACREDNIHSAKQFGTLISQDKNDCFKQTKSVNGVLVTVMYSPPEYRALKKMEEMNFKNETIYDSLLKMENLSASFMMVFGPDESKGNTNDIMYDGISNFKEYAERSLTLNFDMEEHVELNANEVTYKPVLSTLENTYGLTKDRKVNLVFAPVNAKTDLAMANNFDFVYSDETFGVGILHFYFDKKKIREQLPEITIR